MMKEGRSDLYDRRGFLIGFANSCVFLASESVQRSRARIQCLFVSRPIVQAVSA